MRPFSDSFFSLLAGVDASTIAGLLAVVTPGVFAPLYNRLGTSYWKIRAERAQFGSTVTIALIRSREHELDKAHMRLWHYSSAGISFIFLALFTGLWGWVIVADDRYILTFSLFSHSFLCRNLLLTYSQFIHLTIPYSPSFASSFPPTFSITSSYFSQTNCDDVDFGASISPDLVSTSLSPSSPQKALY